MKYSQPLVTMQEEIQGEMEFNQLCVYYYTEGNFCALLNDSYATGVYKIY